MSTYGFLISVSLLVVLSYVFNLVAKRIRVPSVLLLITTGLLITLGGDYLNELTGLQLNLATLYDPAIVEMLGQVGIILIVMEGSLDLFLSRNKRPIVTRAFLAALLILLLSSVAIAFAFRYLHDTSFIRGLAYAIPLSVMSSAIVIPSVAGLQERKREFMIYESTLSDILGIMFFNFVVTTNQTGLGDIALSISTNLLITVGVSLLFAYLLVLMLNYLETQLKLFLIIAILVMLYATGKVMHFSSLLLIFLFGLILNNINTFFSGKLGRIIKKENAKPIVRDFKILTAETAFLVRTFFFVIFGMSIDLSALIDLDVLFVGGIVLLLIYGVRLLNLAVIQHSSIFPELLLAPRGLVTILLFYMIPVSYQIPDFGQGVMFFIILMTSLIMTVGLVVQRQQTEAFTDLELGANPVGDLQQEPLSPLTLSDDDGRHHPPDFTPPDSEIPSESSLWPAPPPKEPPRQAADQASKESSEEPSGEDKP